MSIAGRMPGITTMYLLSLKVSTCRMHFVVIVSELIYAGYSNGRNGWGTAL